MIKYKKLGRLKQKRRLEINTRENKDILKRLRTKIKIWKKENSPIIRVKEKKEKMKTIQKIKMTLIKDRQLTLKVKRSKKYLNLIKILMIMEITWKMEISSK